MEQDFYNSFSHYNYDKIKFFLNNLYRLKFHLNNFNQVFLLYTFFINKFKKIIIRDNVQSTEQLLDEINKDFNNNYPEDIIIEPLNPLEKSKIFQHTIINFIQLRNEFLNSFTNLNQFTLNLKKKNNLIKQEIVKLKIQLALGVNTLNKDTSINDENIIAINN